MSDHDSPTVQTMNGIAYFTRTREDTLPTRVFLSYARGDDGGDYDDPATSLLRRLTDDLAAGGFAVWWDRVSLPSRSLSFTKEIEDAIRACDRFVLFAAPSAAASAWVREELDFARLLCKPITVVLRAGDFTVIPPEVGSVNALDFRPSQREYADSVRDLIDRLGQPAPLGLLRGVPPLPSFHLERPHPLAAARAALCADAIAPTVISAPPRATAVFGAGGVGKSTLAVALAHDCQIRRTFRDGVIWLNVGQTPSLSGLQASIGVTVFGDDGDHYRNEQDGRLALAYLLRDKAALIVLDDVWDVRVVGHFPIEETACRLLITTRSAALARKVDGVDIPVHLLTLDEGAALIAKRVQGDVSDPVYRQITEALGGHTLAVTLAAAQLENGYADDAADLLRLLTKRANPFAHLALSDDDKDENVELSLSLSYNGLKPSIQQRFRLMGVTAFDGVFDRPLLAALWGDADADDVRAPLRTLVDAGLVEEAGEPGTYRQHRLLHAYAHALLSEATEEEGAFARYADHIIIVAEQFNSLPVEQWGALESLLPHINLVGEVLVKRWQSGVIPSPEVIEQAIQFVGNVVKYVQHRPQMLENANGRERRGVQWLEIGLAISRQRGDQKREALFLNELGLVLSTMGEKRAAIAYYEQALVLDRILGDQRGEATTLSNLGAAWSALGEKQQALAFFEQALPLLQAVGDQGGEATTLHNLGAAWSALGEKHKAITFYEQALHLSRAIGDRSGKATTLNNLGGAWSDLGDQDQARAYFAQALALVQALGDRGGEATALSNSGKVMNALGEPRQALALFEAALPLYRAVGDRAGEAVTLFNIGMTYEKLGDVDRAIVAIEGCVALDAAIEHPDLESDRRTLAALKRRRAAG